MPIISIPKSLREKLGEEGSEALAKMLNEQGKETEDSVIKTAELRFEKKLSEEISRFDNSLRKEITRVDNSLQEKIARVDNSLLREIQKSKTDTIKWMFIFWIGQIGAVLGILFAVFK